MLFNPRYGSVGLVGMPFYVVVEVLAPIFEVLSVVIAPTAWWLGVLDWRGFALMLAAMALGNGLLTNAALLMNERGAHSYPVTDLLRLMLLGVADLFLYRPILLVAQAKGMFDFLRGRKSWDKFKRNHRSTASTVQSELARYAESMATTGDRDHLETVWPKSVVSVLLKNLVRQHLEHDESNKIAAHVRLGRFMIRISERTDVVYRSRPTTESTPRSGLVPDTRRRHATVAILPTTMASSSDDVNESARATPDLIGHRRGQLDADERKVHPQAACHVEDRARRPRRFRDVLNRGRLVCGVRRTGCRSGA